MMTPPKPKRVHLHHVPTAALRISITRDGTTGYIACMDGVYRVNLDTGEHARLTAHDSYASGVVLLEDAGVLVSAGYDGVLKWTNLADGTTIRAVKAHKFWSWRLAKSADSKLIASSTGQYLAGGYKYEPAPADEPTVKLFDAATGELRGAYDLTPSVQAVATSPDGQHVAAGNLMGDIRVWEVASGNLVAEWRTDAYTSWGIIKSHCYIGGVFDMTFSPDGSQVVLAGMGPMRDPMAGNGRQLWQRWAWRQSPPKLVDQTIENQAGQGLMEAIAYHPSGAWLVMAGRVFKGDWNAAIFDAATGQAVHTFKPVPRVTGIAFNAEGTRMVLSSTEGQPQMKGDADAANPFGRVEVYDWAG